MNQSGRKPKQPSDSSAGSASGSVIICKCNSITRAEIEEAIRTGADTMNKIFDRTMAGVGPCGGSCRRKILPMLEHYLETGVFPEKIIEDRRGKR